MTQRERKLVRVTEGKITVTVSQKSSGNRFWPSQCEVRVSEGSNCIPETRTLCAIIRVLFPLKLGLEFFYAVSQDAVLSEHFQGSSEVSEFDCCCGLRC